MLRVDALSLTLIASIGLSAAYALVQRPKRVAGPRSVDVPSKILLKVRTVTVGVFFQPNDPAQWRRALEQAVALNRDATAELTKLGYEVQTTRISTNSFEEWCPSLSPSCALDVFKALDKDLEELGLTVQRWPAAPRGAIELVPKIVALSPRISASGSLADPLDMEPMFEPRRRHPGDPTDTWR